MGKHTKVASTMSTTRALLALCIVATACDAKLAFGHAGFRRSYSSGSGAASGSNTGGATPTPAPTPAATEAGGVQIVQVVTMSSPFTSSDIATYSASPYAAAVNFGYGKSIGIVDSSATATTYKTGCSVSSAAVLARRADLSITFTAIVSATLAAAATTASQSLDAAALNTAISTVIANLKQSNAATYGSLTVPIASAVATPTVTSTGGSTSGASTNAVSMFTVFSVAAIALAQH